MGIRYNEHLEFDDGEAVFHHACKMGLEGIVQQAQGLALSLRPLAGLAQDEEPGVRGGAARGGGGLEQQMTVLTMRYQQGHFVVSGSDMEPIKFKTRREARNWCIRHYPGSPIRDSRRLERPRTQRTHSVGG